MVKFSLLSGFSLEFHPDAGILALQIHLGQAIPGMFHEFTSLTVLLMALFLRFQRPIYRSQFSVAQQTQRAEDEMIFKRRPPDGNIRLVHSSGTNLRGVLTNKAGRIVQFESWLERSLLLRLERDPMVKDYGSQPEVFRFVDDDGNQYTYVPDFIVWRCDSAVEIHEVSTSHHQMRLDAQRRMEAGRKNCQARGWRYLIHDEEDLPHGSELANLLALYTYRPSIYANSAVVQMVLEQLSGKGRMSLQLLVTDIAQTSQLPHSIVLACLCHLLWHSTHSVTTDLNQLVFLFGSINPAACVWLEPSERSNL